MNEDVDTRCGLVALVGRPNVGKSTLLNFLLEQKLSITSRKPQTTRQQVLGVKTVDKDQMIFVDTPGLHRNEPRAINKAMNRSATSAMADVDLVLFLIDRGKWIEEDSWVLEKLRSVTVPVALVINKMDLLDDPNALLPELDTLLALHDFAGIFPISALRQKKLDLLENFVREKLPRSIICFQRGKLPTVPSGFSQRNSLGKKLSVSWEMNYPTPQQRKSRPFRQMIEACCTSMRLFLSSEMDKSVLSLEPVAHGCVRLVQKPGVTWKKPLIAR